MTAINEMTPTELRIACAEKCGWKYTLNNIGLTVYNPQGNIVRNISLFFLKNRDDKSVAKLAISNYPDYDHDLNACMELMEKIWEKNEIARIEKCFYDTGTRYEIIDEYHLSSFGKGNTLPIAIMRAFLTVMEEK